MSESFVWNYIAHLPTHQPGIALDIGANYGRYTGLIADKFEQCFAFEPVPYNIRELRKNTEHFNNVTIVPKALDNHIGFTKIFLTADPGCNSILTNEDLFTRWGYTKDDYTYVPTTTLDVFVEDHKNIRFIKCDIEGAESIIFYHGKKMLLENKMDIILEVHANMEPDAHTKLYNYFIDLGYKVFDLDTMAPVNDLDYTKIIHFLITNR